VRAAVTLNELRAERAVAAIKLVRDLFTPGHAVGRERTPHRSSFASSFASALGGTADVVAPTSTIR
jgi:hypothetical protein